MNTLMRITLLAVVCCLIAVPLSAQQRTAPEQPSTRPPEDNDRTLRELTPEEIPPNLNFYAIDPLYDLCDEGISDGGHNHSDCQRTSHDEAARLSIRGVAHIAGEALDSRFGLRAHKRAVSQRTRNS